MSHLELTLVLAATRDMGIGLNGTLPWTGLKKEMAYFARVTKRLPPQARPSAVNAVIMGRKTWDSIPPRFRPLKGRLNVVISRSTPAASHTSTTATNAAAAAAATTPPAGEVADSGPLYASSLAKALEQLRARHDTGALGRVFVIGGAQIYGAALELASSSSSSSGISQQGPGETRRILLTRIRSPFECDTFFPLRLPDEGGGDAAGGWVRRTKEELDAWTGEDVPGGVQVEGGTEYEFEMWEKVPES